MAEGLLRSIGRDAFEVESAGTEPGQLHPLAVQAMAELDIDIAGQHAKAVTRYTDANFDYVITVCDQARETCPIFPGAQRQLHWSLPDPSMSNDLQAFRQVRDALRQLISDFIAGAEK
jgi:arsenate reductase